MIRKLIPGALALGLAASTHAQTPVPAAPKEATTPAIEVPAAPPLDPAVVRTDSSYALGYRTGGGFAQQFGKFGVNASDLDTDNFLKGFMTAVKGSKPDIADEKLQAAMEALGKILEVREKEIAATNLETGAKFLAENGKRAGVTTNPSGLQYEVIAKGGTEKYVAPKETKDAPPAEKQFIVNYKGTLIDGKEFDASPAGEPATMTLQVVDGFKEALTTMPVGAKWKLFMPGNLAYGEQRRSSDIGPNSTLIFELELLKIEDAPPQQGMMPFPMPGQGGPGGPGGPPGE